MLILIILASLIPGTLAVLEHIQNDKAKKELNSKIDSLTINNLDLKKSIRLLSQDNANLSHQLTETAMKLNNQVIGNGDLDIEINATKPTEFRFRFKNNSELSVNNISIIIQNYSEIMKCPILRESKNEIVIKSDCYMNKHTRISGFTLNPKAAYLDETVYQLTSGYMNFAFRIATLKKTNFYHIAYKIINGCIYCSKREYNVVNDKLIFVKEINDLNLPDEYWSKNFYTKTLSTD
ncbi:MAG: hypothetical protein H6Q17_1715 [Bacteroidetes bacterium]|nr:hypothetical protein [Bacteroidota bacterium]